MRISRFIKHLIPTGWRLNWLLAILIVILAGPCLYQQIISFRLPMVTESPMVDWFIRMKMVLIIWLFLFTVYVISKKTPIRWLNLGFGLLLLPCCFIATSSISGIDYAYIFFPALKILQGTPVFDIYFQYDLFLALIATIWIKLGFPLGELQSAGQLSYVIALGAVFFISQKLFRRNFLSVILLIVLVLIRIYASTWDIIFHFQATPLRLDLWLIVFVIIWLKGPFHVLTGFACGLLIFWHRNFGIIHTIAYVQLLLLLSFIQYTQYSKRLPSKQRIQILIKQLLPNLLIILAFYIAFSLLFRNENANAASYYQKIGIGFLPMSNDSFFWYYMTIFPIAFILLYHMREQVCEKYLVMGFFVLFCTIGNCIYYFGRSHDGNLFNISISLIFLLFYVFDLVDRLLFQSDEVSWIMTLLKKRLVPFMAILLTSLVTFTYAGQITAKVSKQFDTVLSGHIHHSDPFAPQQPEIINILQIVKNITRDSANVQIFDENSEKEFLLYFYGNYKPQGYFHPFTSWIFVDALTTHLQDALNKGDYILLQTDVYNDLFAKRLVNVGLTYPIDQRLTLIASAKSR